MDLPLKLKLLRESRGLSQKDLAKLTRVGEKTISSFETGQRIGSIKLGQLERMVTACGTTLVAFLQWDPRAELIASMEPAAEEPAAAVVDLPTPIRRSTNPVDPLARFRRDDATMPGPQSSLSRVLL